MGFFGGGEGEGEGGGGCWGGSVACRYPLRSREPEEISRASNTIGPRFPDPLGQPNDGLCQLLDPNTWPMARDPLAGNVLQR